MNVLFASAEVTPFAKAGGLADVVGSLPIALRKFGVDVRIIMPRYEHLSGSPRLDLLLQKIEVAVDGGIELVKLYHARLPGTEVPVYLIENDTYLSHGPIYNQRGTTPLFSELARFLFFSAAVVAVLPQLGWRPSVIHCHDWHTGMLPLLVERGSLRDIKTVFTIHNLAHQGVWNAAEVFRFLGLRERDHPNLKERGAHKDLNLLQQGMLGATLVNTVSPQYAQEILTPQFGLGLERSIQKRKRAKEFSGILNGIDTALFNPATDRHIRVRYERNSLAKKTENKKALHELCGFSPDTTIPTFGFIQRLAEQKGIELLAAKSTMFVEAGARLVVLGSGHQRYERLVEGLTAKYPKNIHARIGFDAPFAQHIYAGADMFLVPSKFEPCGIGQMIAMRYGTLPIVHATGGLKDTVPDLDEHPDTGLGFTFSSFTPDAFWGAVERALRVYKNSARWLALMDRCMTADFSWDHPAREYLAVYEQALAKTL